MRKINFTKSLILRLNKPRSGRDYYADSKELGLQLSITHNGTISFFLRKKYLGKDQRFNIGHFPDITVEIARKMALSIKSDIAQGINPNNKISDNIITFSQLFSDYLERYASLHKGKRTIEEDNRRYKLYMKTLYTQHIQSIVKNDIMKLHNKLANEISKVTANRVLSLIGAIFNVAIGWGYKLINPTARIKKFSEISRDRFVKESEMARFLESVDCEESQYIKDYVLISLLTGARRSNILSMKWKDIDLEQEMWTINASESKNNHANIVYLSGEVINILQLRKRLSISHFVFPSHGKTGHLMEPRRGWERILKRAGISNLRLHDLRRTFGSYQAMNNTSMHIIGKTLNHKSQGATTVYARFSDDPVKAAVCDANKAILKLRKVES